MLDFSSLPPSLPIPSDDLQAHSQRLVSRIREDIDANGGLVTFAHYMQLALYAPGLGYYSAGSRKFGVGGDFVTAPEISPLFSICLARNCAQVLNQVTDGNILELGAGSGVMACDVLLELEASRCLPRKYLILEVSADLRARQGALVKERIPHLAERVEWLDRLPESGFCGVVLGNEVLDAMPVHRFCISQAGLKESNVGWQDDHFFFNDTPLPNGPIAARIEAIKTELGDDTLYPGYCSEVNLAAEAWLTGLAHGLERGAIILVDYGFPRREYYHRDRKSGTIMCHYRHRSHPDPLILPGLQDITAHVEFTAVAEAGHSAGLSILGYTTQAYFLLASGLDALLARSDPNEVKRHLEITQQVKKLTLPNEMGELFKVIALGKGLDAPLMGFSLFDQRGRL